MTAGHDQMERLPEDIYFDRRITASTYCSKCGYNLRTLPYIYSCPECGQQYNARPLHMKGIYLPADHEPPVGRMVVAAFWYLLAIPMIRSGLNPPETPQLAFGGLFLSIALWYSVLVIRQLHRYQLARHVARRIRDEEDE